jgi:predicted lipid carrier protein YhbT
MPVARVGRGMIVASVAAVAARAFFEGLEARAERANLDGLEHSYRFEIEGEGSWNVRVHAGRVVVTESPDDGSVDATVRMNADLFDALVAGRQSAATAYMRRRIKVDGDLGAVLKLQRLFG